MKKNIFFTILVFLASCTNVPINIKSKVTVTVSPSSVLSAFTFYNSSDMEMYSDDDGLSVLRITALLYDASGNLVESKEIAIDDFSNNCEFSFVLPEGESYKFVCFGSCIQGPLSKPVYQAYEIEGISSLTTLKVTQVNENSYYSTLSILCGCSADISSDEAYVKLNLAPITSLVYAKWTDIHAHDGKSGNYSSVYGTYEASAENYWGSASYNWTMTVEQDGNSTTDVIIKNLDPYLVNLGYTAEEGCNIFKGVIEGNRIRISANQETGCINSEKNPLLLEGISRIEGDNLYFGDLFLTISDGKLVTENMFGVQVTGDEGWYSLYDSGIVFTQNGFVGVGVDKYGFIYHNNDFLSCTSNGYTFGTTLSGTENNGIWVEPALNSGNNIYSMINLLPGTYNKFGRTLIGNDRKDYSEGNITVEQGKQYVFVFDCKNLTVTFTPGIDAMTKSIEIFNQSVQSFKVSSQQCFHPIEKSGQISKAY